MEDDAVEQLKAHIGDSTRLRFNFDFKDGGTGSAAGYLLELDEAGDLLKIGSDFGLRHMHYSLSDLTSWEPAPI